MDDGLRRSKTLVFDARKFDESLTMAIGSLLDVAGLLFVAVLPSFCGSELSLETGLQFSKEPQSVVVLRNHPALLNCVAVGVSDGDVEISWNKDGVEVMLDRRVSVMANGSLYFRHVVRNIKRHLNDEGRYECVATSHIGAIVSRQAYLQVADLNHFSGQPQNSTVAVGETAHFRCQINGVPKPTVEWQKNEAPLQLSDRYISLPSYSLLIYNSSHEDAGIYRCRAENMAGERFSKGAELTISTAVGVARENTPPPRMLVGPRDQQVLVGEKALLECTTTHAGGTQPLIQWSRKEGVPLPNERIKVLGYYNIEIQSVQETDAGVYTCSLPDWPDVAAAEATLTVLVPPRPVDASENIIRPTAHTVRMTCEFEGVPAPNITWMKDGQLVKSNGRIKIKGDPGTLLISQSSAVDSGLYQCWAENVAGRAGKIIRLYIKPSENAPDPPRGLRTLTVASRAIELTWESSPPKNGRMTMAYSVHYLLTNGGPELQKVVEDPRARSENPRALIEQLQPHTNYTFYVVAYNDRSASQHSEPITQMTLEDVPTSAPGIEVFPAGATLLKVQWESLSPDKARGTITQYQIYYRRHGQPTQNVIKVNGTINQHSINGLETGIEYDVRVLAGTRVGFPTLTDDQWPWVSQTVSSSANIGVTPMANVQFVVINPTTIQLFWDLPTTVTVDLLGFKISYKVHGSPEEAKMIILDAVTNHPIYQLKPDTLYEISICPFTDLGDGDLITKNVRTFPEGYAQGPPVPTAVTTEPLNETAILLKWSEPEFSGGSITHFTVRYFPVPSGCPVPTTNNNVTHFLERISHASQLVITDLSPFTVYQFTVQSHTMSSKSQPSEEVCCQTKEGCPLAPQKVAVYLVGPTDIEVNWQPPMIPNGVITSYIIHYSDEKTALISDWLTQVENGTAKTTVISGLKSNTLYSIKVQAMTRRCEGLYSLPFDLMTREAHIRKNESVNARLYSDRTMGIVIGICICGGCIIFCLILIVVLRNRTLPCDRNRQTTHAVNGSAEQVRNGRPGSNPLLRFNVVTGNDKEVDSSLHMINKSQGSEHIDSKGGPMVKKCKQNGELAKANGFSGYSKQNGGASQSLLSQHKLSEGESTEVSKASSFASPPAEAVKSKSHLTECSTDGIDAVTKV